jgi:hypothetical protein
MADETPASEEPAAPARSSGEPSAPAERYGILAITRHVKDDGRALLLYSDIERGRT